jgi:hypothetical protein
MIRALARLLACCGLALLASCGGGGGYGGGNNSTPPNASPGGIWMGTDSITGLAVEGIIDEGGEGHFIRSDGVQYIGTAITSGNSFSANVDAYTALGTTFPDGSSHATGTVTGTIDERVSITADTNFTTDKGTVTNGTLNLTFSQLYNQPSSLAAIAGNYTDVASGTAVSVDASGVISAQDANTGCVINGNVTLIDAAYNAYGVQVSYANCLGTAAVLNGATLTGLAALDTSSNPVQVIAGVSGTNGGVTYAIVYTLNR